MASSSKFQIQRAFLKRADATRSHVEMIYFAPCVDEKLMRVSFRDSGFMSEELSWGHGIILLPDCGACRYDWRHVEQTWDIDIDFPWGANLLYKFIGWLTGKGNNGNRVQFPKETRDRNRKAVGIRRKRNMTEWTVIHTQLVNEISQRNMRSQSDS